MRFYFDLPNQHGYETRMVSPENPNGAKGGACRADPNDTANPHAKAASKLGKGWKVRPFLWVKANETATLMDVEGPGAITYIWFATNHSRLSELVLRMYWDGEQTPSVEAPLGAFFAMGFDYKVYEVNSAIVTVAPRGGMNCYWPMPFREHARITLHNDSDDDISVLAYKIMYNQTSIPSSAMYFHAQYRRSVTTVSNPEHVIIDGVQGCGSHVGTYLAWIPSSTGWWGEGEVKFFLDGDREYPTISDTGTEDYFGGAWNFGAQGTLPVLGRPNIGEPEKAFNAPFFGLPLAEVCDPNGPRKYSMYRWHANDAIAFAKDLKVTVQSLAWLPDKTFRPSMDDIASVAYWYQAEPHGLFPALPSRAERWDR